VSGAVLHLITTLDRGGAEKALLHLAAAQAASRDAQVEVAYLKGDGELTGEFEAAGVPVHDLALRGLAAVGAYGRARRLVRELAPAIVHTHLFKADTLGAALLGPRRVGRTVLVSTKHNEDVYLRERTWSAVGKRVAARADALVAITPGVARFAHETLGDTIPRLETIPYGLPTAAPNGDGPAFRRTHGVGADEVMVLSVARLVDQKDHATLFAALRRMRSSAHVVLLGRGPLESHLRSEAEGLPITFAGFVEAPDDAYAAADLLVLSSVHEGLGLVILEAARHGVPAVATHVGGIPDVIEDGVTGLLVPPRSPADLATALDSLVLDARTRREFGEAARERVAALHGVAPCLKSHDRLYTELMERRR
jgi:glycosyltransferase involved in cell wall biosynthesis